MPWWGSTTPYAEAEAIIKEFQRSGFDMNKLSIVGKDYHTEQRVIGSSLTTPGDRMKAWDKPGAFWDGLWRLLSGSAVLCRENAAAAGGLK